MPGFRRRKDKDVSPSGADGPAGPGGPSEPAGPAEGSGNLAEYRAPDTQSPTQPPPGEPPVLPPPPAPAPGQPALPPEGSTYSGYAPSPLRRPLEQTPWAPVPPRRGQPGPGAPGPGQEMQGPQRQQAPRPPWARFVLGRPTARFEAKPPPADPYRPDTLFDGWSTPGLTVRLASVRGDAHRFGGQPRQDDIVVVAHEPTGAVVFAVADGVSAAPQSHVGAALASRTAVADAMRQLDEGRPQVDWKRVVEAAAYQLFMRITRGADPTSEQRAEAQSLLATTLVTGIVRPAGSGQVETNLVHVGDSGAWILRGGLFHSLLGGKAERQDGIVTSAVRALPWVPPRIEGTWFTLPEDGVLLIGTDGFGDPLGDGTGRVGEVMARELARPPREPQAVAQLLDFSRETFDDDRTLLAVWPRHRLDERGGPRALAPRPPHGAV